jgi:hypothetical protein
MTGLLAKHVTTQPQALPVHPGRALLLGYMVTHTGPA